MGATTRHVESLADLEVALKWAQGNNRATVISIVSDAYAWVPGDAEWNAGVPDVSQFGAVRKARLAQDAIRANQRIGV